VMARKPSGPERPKARRKCHAKADNVAGWLEVITYATTVNGACVVDGSSEEHRVIVRSDSPLPYFIAVRGTCTTDGVAYVDGSGQAKKWEPNAVFLKGRDRGPAVEREIGCGLVVVEECADETLEVAVSWECKGFTTADPSMPPLVIQVDTRSPAGS
jgi:hypothetical protein